MVFLSRKAVAAAAVIVLLAAAFSAGAWAVFMPAESTGLAVVIDPGHGGWDGGVTVGGVKESELNLELAKTLARELEQRGIAVVMTREEDVALGETKRSDMEARASIIESARAECVVSIHLNSFPSQPSRRGVQVFYDDTGRGGALASALQSRLNARINATHCGRSDLQPQPGDLYITKCSDLPSVIVECGFLSNADDRRLLGQKSYRKELCGAIADALEELLT